MPSREWQYFQRSEFACHHCGKNLTADRLIDRLDELRAAWGFPLRVLSGYRCPLHNAAVSTTGPSGPHTTGWAVDLECDRTGAWYVLKIAMNLGFTGIGVKQKGAGRFLHLDILPDSPKQPRPTVWSY